MSLSLEQKIMTFGFAQEDCAALQSFAGTMAELLPLVQESLRNTVHLWPELAKALQDPQLVQAQAHHWRRLCRGDITGGYQESARSVAAALYEQGVPAYGISVFQGVVLRVLLRSLEKVLEAEGRVGEFAQLSVLLTKLFWFDLQNMLEVYAERQADQRQAFVRRITDAFERRIKGMIEDVAASSQEMTEISEQMAKAASAANETAVAVAAAVEQATRNVSTVAAAAEQMTAAVKEIARQVAETQTYTEDAVARTNETAVAMEELASAADDIGEIVTLISDIAGQTNLLALNATIEAARAGDAGKGFAVVASEVKALANQTAKATEEIRTRIERIQDQTKSSVQAIADIRKTIQKVNEANTTISSAVEEQSASTQEIARNTQEAAAGTQEVAQRIVEVKDGAGESSRTAKVVQKAATALRAGAGQLKEEVARFLAELA